MGQVEVIRLLLALKGERRIVRRASLEYAFCQAHSAEVVELLVTAGPDRLPSASVYQAVLDRWHNFPNLQFWSLHWANRPTAARMVEWRAAVEAQRGLHRIGRCCEDGRPLELDRSLHVLGANRLLTMDDLTRWRNVAKERGHDECVKVLTEAIALKT